MWMMTILSVYQNINMLYIKVIPAEEMVIALDPVITCIMMC